MGNQYEAMTEEHQAMIRNQKMFFVATAAPEGRINLSPKGLDSFRIEGPNRVAWLNLTGSGNETAAHLLESNRMTVMFCAYEGKPCILRLYGTARTIHPRDEEWGQWMEKFDHYEAARQVFVMDIDLVQTSCGFGVPLYEYQGQRDILNKWSERKGKQGVRDYWEKNNQVSIDGKPTKIFG